MEEVTAVRLYCVAACMILILGAAVDSGTTGTWEWGSPEKGGGILLLREGPSGVDFQLELWRGAPTQNMGFLEGRLEVKAGKATFLQREGNWVCEIAFVFDGEHVKLRQVQGSDAACGFGHAVYADGTFKRTSRKTPVFRKQPG